MNDNLTPDIQLSTGRIINHTRMDNGSQLATPTTGSYEMTNSEWLEYCSITRLKIEVNHA
jgi:hypothetical protein